MRYSQPQPAFVCVSAREWPKEQLGGPFPLFWRAKSPSAWNCQNCQVPGPVCIGVAATWRSPTLTLCLFSFPNFTKPQNQSWWLLRRSHPALETQPEVWTAGVQEHNLVFARVDADLLAPSLFPSSLRGSLNSHQIFGLSGLWIYRALAHPTSRQDTSPTAVQTTHSSPPSTEPFTEGNSLEISPGFAQELPKPWG